MRDGKTDLHVYIKSETNDLIQECQQFLKEKYASPNQAISSKSAVVRNAIRLYHSFVVKKESQIHPDDPRYN